METLPFTLNKSQKVGGMVAVALGTGYSALKLRLLPVCVMRAWFVFTALSTIFPASAILYLIDPIRYLGIPRRFVQRICTVIMSCSFKLCSFLNPQIKMSIKFDKDANGSDMKGWSDISPNGVAYALNHTSFWDVFQLIHVMPVSYLISTRTLMKSTLRNIPVFGGCFDRVGHFPVYFKSDEDGNFSVDKEKQTVVQVKVDEHLNHGGNIAIFPEGAVNRNPNTLKTFRFGTFATIFQHKMPLYYMVSVGNEKTWPATAPFGGYPADIRIRCGAYPIDFDTKDSKQVAQEFQAFMQKVRDEMVEEMEKENQTKKPKKLEEAAGEEPRLATA